VASAKQFSDVRYISLETFRKDGQGVKTPVWVLEDGGALYVRTDPKSWKAKRLRRNERVRLAPSDARGKVKGAWVDGEAHFVAAGAEAERISELFKKKYGVMGALVNAVNGLRGRHSDAIISIDVA
jgi:PPOX class probable F420-dependent enzyme